LENLYLVIGLGNPGSDYAQTRHNAGFMALNLLAERRSAVWRREPKFQAQVARAEFEGRRLALVQPQTFMNQSGVAVQALAAYYQLPHRQLLVVLDDADLTLGQLRLRPSGSSGGHHGLESIERHLGTRAYARLRIGIGRREDGVREITDYVLGRFAEPERPLVRTVLERACRQIECWLTAGVAKAMNEFNGMINTPSGEES
jgi:PTH1 family peptidyl-tRNA hydrolase